MLKNLGGSPKGFAVESDTEFTLTHTAAFEVKIMPSMRTSNPLDNDALAKYAPSVFTVGKNSELSSRYAPVATIDIIEGLRREGFFPMYVSQSGSRLPNGRAFARHALRFQQLNGPTAVGDSIPEIVYTNSHDGSSTSHLSAGIYRLVCSNGMVAGESFADVRVRHTGEAVDKTIEGVYDIVSQFGELSRTVKRLKSIELTRDEKVLFGESSVVARYGDEHHPITALQVISPRRHEDTPSDLWTTLNVVQENLIQGGLRGISSTSSRLRTRGVTSITENIKLNKALWTLAERMAELKSA